MSQSINPKKAKFYGPEKCPMFLKNKITYILPYSKMIERKVVDITIKVYFSVNPRVLFAFKPKLQQPVIDLMTPEKIVLLSTIFNTTAKVVTLSEIPDI